MSPQQPIDDVLVEVLIDEEPNHRFNPRSLARASSSCFRLGRGGWQESVWRRIASACSSYLRRYSSISAGGARLCAMTVCVSPNARLVYGRHQFGVWTSLLC